MSDKGKHGLICLKIRILTFYISPSLPTTLGYLKEGWIIIIYQLATVHTGLGRSTIL